MKRNLKEKKFEKMKKKDSINTNSNKYIKKEEKKFFDYDEEEGYDTDN